MKWLDSLKRELEVRRALKGVTWFPMEREVKMPGPDAFRISVTMVAFIPCRRPDIGYEAIRRLERKHQ